MTTVEVWGADSGDFVGGRLIWSVLNALAPSKSNAPDQVDLTKLARAHPYALAAVTALGILAEGKAQLVLPSTYAARDFVVRSGVLSFFQCSDATDLAQSPRIVPVRQLQSVSATFADEISRAWESEFGGMPAGLRPLLAGHLDEVMLNALSHAESPIGCVVAAQVYPNRQRVELAVLDLGQSIRGHLTKSRSHATILRDDEAIVRATEEGVSGTPEGQLNRLGDPNSGVGLYELRRYCESGGGELTIVSGTAMVTLGRGASPVIAPFAGGFPGCLVNVVFHVGS